MASSVNGADCGATGAQRKGRNEREKLHQKRELRQGMVRPHTGGMVEKRVGPKRYAQGSDITRAACEIRERQQRQ